MTARMAIQKLTLFAGLLNIWHQRLLLGRAMTRQLTGGVSGPSFTRCSPPHYSKNRKQMMQDIVEKPIEMKTYFSVEAKSLL
jgi:hypothetical protein